MRLLIWFVVTLKRIVMSNDYHIAIYNVAFQKPPHRSEKLISVTEPSFTSFCKSVHYVTFKIGNKRIKFNRTALINCDGFLY